TSFKNCVSSMQLGHHEPRIWMTIILLANCLSLNETGCPSRFLKVKSSLRETPGRSTDKDGSSGMVASGSFTASQVLGTGEISEKNFPPEICRSLLIFAVKLTA